MQTIMAGYVSIAELPNSDLVLDRPADYGPIGWDIALPSHIDPERLQVNVRRMKCINRAAGFSGSIATEYHGDKTDTDFVAAVNADGSAIAGKAKIQKAEQSKTNLIHSDIHGPRSYITGKKWLDIGEPGERRVSSWGRPIANHRINREEMVNNIIDSKSKKDDHHKWACELNTGIKNSYRRAMHANLTTVDASELLLDSTLTPATYFSIVSSIAVSGEAANVAFISLLGMLKGMHFMVGSIRNNNHHAKPLNEFRPSLFVEAQFDRYIAARAILESGRLIRARP